MSRAIDADALVKVLEGVEEYLDGEGLNSRADGVRDAIMDVHDSPTIEPERKKGKWITISRKGRYGYEWMKCSECGDESIDVPVARVNFCPNCGADMRGEE